MPINRTLSFEDNGFYGIENNEQTSFENVIGGENVEAYVEELETDEQYVKTFGTPSVERSTFLDLHQNENNETEDEEPIPIEVQNPSHEDHFVRQLFATRKSLRVLDNQDLLKDIRSEQDIEKPSPNLDIDTEKILGLWAVTQQSARLNDAQSELIYKFFRTVFKLPNGSSLPSNPTFKDFCANTALR
jgi:hypothetical protein